MATNVYAPLSYDLSSWGFRWCSKDQRWERRKAMNDGDSRILANRVGCKVEVIQDDGSRTEHTPVSCDLPPCEVVADLGPLFRDEED